MFLPVYSICYKHCDILIKLYLLYMTCFYAPKVDYEVEFDLIVSL